MVWGLRVSLDEQEGQPRRLNIATAREGGAARLALQVEEAATFLKALSHEGRLLILVHLSDGERSVTELERILGTRQAAVSQQLARLRLEGLVATRREGKVIFYSIADARVRRMIDAVGAIFRPDDMTESAADQPRPI